MLSTFSMPRRSTRPPDRLSPARGPSYTSGQGARMGTRSSSRSRGRSRSRSQLRVEAHPAHLPENPQGNSADGPAHTAQPEPVCQTSPSTDHSLAQQVQALSRQVAALEAQLAAQGSTSPARVNGVPFPTSMAMPDNSLQGDTNNAAPLRAASAEIPTSDPSLLAAILTEDAQDHTPEVAALMAGARTQQAIGLDTFVSSKTREKIWSNQFVEFSTLLPSYKEDHTFQFKDKDGSLCLTATKPSKYLSLNDWITAFATFSAVYTQKWPEQSPALLKYMEIVRNIASRGGDFRRYDETFRRIRERNQIAWDSLHTELYLMVMPTSSHSRNMQLSSHSRNTQSFCRTPNGYCIKFHKGQHCPGCKYKHTCYSCGGGHQISNCPKQNKTNSHGQGGKSSPNTKATNTNKN